MTQKSINASLSFCLLFSMAVCADPSTDSTEPSRSLLDAFSEGTFQFKARLRHAHIEEDKFRDGDVTTLFTRVNYHTAAYRGFDAFIELDNNNTLSDDDVNNTTNGNTAYPIELDYGYTDINQAWVAYRQPINGFETTFKYGDQRLTVLNHRFLGNVGWRQNEQTFGALTVRNLALFPNTFVRGGYIYKIKSIFKPHDGDDNRSSDFPFAVVEYRGIPHHRVTGYGFLMDLDDQLAKLSNKTFGVRLDGDVPYNGFRVRYTAEYAHQTDYADASDINAYDENYWHLILGTTHQVNAVEWNFDIGYELLQGQLVTPLATLHAMNGWADRFLPGTSPLGLSDLYAKMVAHWDLDLPYAERFTLFLRFHHFEADKKSIEYGEEINFEARVKINKHFTASLRHASYFSENESGLPVPDRDVHKSWFYVSASF